MARGRLITIGSFDGVHRGHQALLHRVCVEAKKRKLKSLALTFAVPPRMILGSEQTKMSILSDSIEKEFLLKREGIDEIKFLPFQKQLISTKPFLFFRDYLIKNFQAKGIVVGYDFRFGMDRSAGAVELVRWGLEFEIPVWVIPPVRWNKQIVSSSAIRNLLEGGYYKKALGFLGHPYLIIGRVVKDQGKGAKMGFPTANIKTFSGKTLPRGVYVVRAGVKGPKGGKKDQFLTGVCNIGTRPTLTRENRIVVEAHFFNFKGSLRGKTLGLQLLHRIRSEKRFSSIKELQKAIKQDVIRARKYLSGQPQRKPLQYQ